MKELLDYIISEEFKEETHDSLMRAMTLDHSMCTVGITRHFLSITLATEYTSILFNRLLEYPKVHHEVLDFIFRNINLDPEGEDALSTPKDPDELHNVICGGLLGLIALTQDIPDEELAPYAEQLGFTEY